MSIIKSQNVNEIIRKTLGIINPKIIVHGEIVGYMLYKMLECDGRYSEQELLDYPRLGIRRRLYFIIIWTIIGMGW